MTDQAKPSGAAAFRDRAKKHEEGTLLKLSSGKTVLIRRPNESALIRSGVIPSQLALSAVNVRLGKGTPVDLRNSIELQQLYARLALVDPVVVEGEPSKDNEIKADWLESSELNEIYFYVVGGMDGLNNFREAGQRLPAGPDSEEVPGDQAE